MKNAPAMATIHSRQSSTALPPAQYVLSASGQGPLIAAVEMHEQQQTTTTKITAYMIGLFDPFEPLRLNDILFIVIWRN